MSPMHLLEVLVVGVALRGGWNPCLAAEGQGAGAAGEGDLRARVQKAVAAGRRNLLGRLEELLASTPRDYPMGKLALPVAALLKAGASTGDSRIRAALKTLEGMPLEKTYCVACYLFALDGLCRRLHEEGREGLPLYSVPDEKDLPSRKATGKTREKMAELAGWLVEAQNAGHGSWTYQKPRKGGSHDFSNTQFAVLGLQVAVEHGIPVPDDVFRRVALVFGRCLVPETEPLDFEIERAVGLEEKLKKTRVVRTLRCRAVPGGWGYTDARKGKGRKLEPRQAERKQPYASMTAAGASSLVIAARALEGKTPSEAEKALQASHAWITKHFSSYLAAQTHLYYTLYSLEKVGDLAGLEKFGKHDWYREGAERILAGQRRDGGWGGFVNTSFALLFLTRATRPLDAASAPIILTGGGKEERGDKDLVYIARLDGFISAGTFLSHLAEARRPELLPVAEEIARNYAPDFKEDLVPLLLRLWTKPDKVTAFARKALPQITGICSARREDQVAWWEELEDVRRLETREDSRPEELAAALEGTESVALKVRLVGLAQRKGLKGLAGALVKELSVPSVEYRRKIHGILSLWFDRVVTAPVTDDGAAWEGTAREWMAWWHARAGGKGTP